MENKIGIIINANAKKNRKMKFDPLEVYGKIGGEYVDIRYTRSLEELDEVIKDFKKNGIAYLGVAGGDGSLHHALTHAMWIFREENIPPILILKGGTMDNVSRSIHLKGKGPDILKRLVEKMKNGEKIDVHSRLTMKIGKSYCFLFGTGFVTNFLNEVYSGKEKGIVRNLQVIFRAVKEIIRKPAGPSLFDGVHGEFLTDMGKVDLDYTSAILAGTVEHIGMGFSPLSRALEKKGAMHAIITGIEPGELLRNLNRVRRGRDLGNPKHHTILVKKLIIKSERPFQYTMDGDMYEASGSLEVNIGPEVGLVSV